MGLSDIYYKLEDKWYNFLDKVDEKIPIYNIIDPIDKVIPSFIVFIVLILLLIGGIGFLLLGGISEPEPQGAVPVTIIIEDSDGEIIPAVKASFSYGEFSFEKSSDPSGEIALKLDLDTELTISIENAKYEPFEQTITIDSDPFEYVVVLYAKGSDVPEEIERLIKLTDYQGRSLRGTNVSVSFSCSESGIFPTPRTTNTTTGEVTVKQPSNCGTLLASINADGYNFVDSYPIDDDTTIISLDALGSDPENNPVCGNNRCEFGESNNSCSLDCSEGEDTEPPFNPLKGTLEVNVSDDEGALDDITVKLLDRFSSIVDSETTWAGYAPFYDIIPGTYSINVSDSQNNYVAETLSNVTISAGQKTIKNIVLERVGEDLDDDGDDNPDDDEGEINDNRAHFITFDVLDNATNTRITNATVRLLNNDYESVLDKSTGQFGSKLFFPIDTNTTFNAFITAEDYEDKELGSIKADQNITARMNKLTIPRTTGNIKVIVSDENNRKVRGARVQLIDADTNLSNWNSQITDVNGETVFTGKSAGKYYAYAFTDLANGESDTGSVIVGQEITLPIRIVIGNTKLNLTITDNDDNPLANAQLEIFEQGTNTSLGQTILSDSDGKIVTFIKAGKTVYFKITKADYSSLTTESITLAPSTTINRTLVLERIILSQNPQVIFEGMFQGNQEAEFLEAGKTYDARIKILIPQEENFIRAGLHFRVGRDNQLFENSPIIIKQATSGNAAVIKSTTFTPSTGETNDLANLTNSDAKWANIIWENVSTGTYSAVVKVKIRENVSRATELQIFYRGWAEETGSKFFRDPVDSVLGQGATSSQRQALYANTNSKLFEEGTTPQPNDAGIGAGDDDILNTQTQLYELKPFNLENNGNFVYEFSLFNLGDAILDNALLDLRNTDGSKNLYKGISTTQSHLVLTGYEIKTVGGNTLTASNLNVKEFTGLRIGRLEKNTRIDGKLYFKTQISGPTNIHLRISNAGRILYDELTRVSVKAADSLNIFTDISSLTAFAANNVKVIVTNEAGEEIEGASVDFYKQVQNERTLLTTTPIVSNINGIVNYSIPDFGNDYNIVITAKKLNFNDGEKKLIAKTQIIDILPKSFSEALNSISPREAFENFTFDNKTKQIDLFISKIQINGDEQSTFYNLDKERMENYLTGVLPPNKFYIRKNMTGTQSITQTDFFKTVLRNTQLRAGSYKADIIITVASDDVPNSEWVIDPITLTANISVGQDVQGGCLYVENTKWEAVTSETGSTSYQFKIQNNCRAGNTYIPLQKLKFKLEYAAENETARGDFSLAVDGNPVSLRPNLWVESLPVLRNGTEYFATLTYRPYPGDATDEGKTVNAVLSVDADNLPTQEFVNSQATKLPITIEILNLEKCFVYNMKTSRGTENVTETEKFKMLESDTDIFLDLENKNCAGPIEVELCKNEETENGSCGIANNTGLNPAPKKATIDNGKTVSFKLNNPTTKGAYSINIKAKLARRAVDSPILIKRIKIEADGELFTDNPFVEVVSSGDNREAYIVPAITIYNKSIGSEGPLATAPIEFDHTKWIALTPPITIQDGRAGGIGAIGQGLATGDAVAIIATALGASNPLGWAIFITTTIIFSVAFDPTNIWEQYWMPDIYTIAQTQTSIGIPRTISLKVNSSGTIQTTIGAETYYDSKTATTTLFIIPNTIASASPSNDSSNSENGNTIRFDAPLSLSISPQNKTINSDETQNFTASVSGGYGNYSYNWSVYPAEGCTITGANTQTFSVKCEVSNTTLVPEKEDTNVTKLDSKQKDIEVSLYDLTGDRYRRRLRGEKHIWGQGNEDYGQGDRRMTVDIVCPTGYILEDEADYIGGDIDGDSIWTSRINQEDDDCWFDGLTSPSGTSGFSGAKGWSGNVKQATFSAHCNGRRFHDFELNYDAYATCKYSQWENLDGGETGRAKIGFNIENEQIIQELTSGKQVYVTLTVIGKDKIFNNRYPDVGFGKIRVELSKKQEERLPDRDLDDAVCDIGVTGEEELPKIGLAKGIGWKWSDISEHTCADTNYVSGNVNNNYIYCDATQFSISLLKRINTVQQFLSNNSSIMSCPNNPLQSDEPRFYLEGQNGEDQPYERDLSVVANNFGVKEIQLTAGFNDKDNNPNTPAIRTVRALIRIQNNYSSLKKIAAKAILVNQNNQTFNCTQQQWETGDILWEEKYWSSNDTNFLYKSQKFVSLPENNYNPANEDNTTEGITTMQCLFENVTEGDNYQLRVSLKKFNSYTTILQGDDIFGNPNGTNYENGNQINDKNGSFDSRTAQLITFNLIEAPPRNAEGTSCETRASTERNGAIFVPALWLDAENPEFESIVTTNPSSIQWSPINNLQEFENLTHFNAFIIDDSLSQDFRKDFDDYSKGTFANAPTWYIDSTNGLGKIFSNPNIMQIENQSIPGSSRISAGKYKVDIDIVFDQTNRWKFFSSGQPTASIIVRFYKLGSPDQFETRNSIFYYLPFNGTTGLQGNSISREGYGMSYAGPQIKINETANNAQTFADNASNPTIKLFVEKANTTSVLNSTLNTRGKILTVEDIDDSKKKMIFAPSIATPVLLKVTNNSFDSPLNVFYQLTERGAIAKPGENLTYWNSIKSENSQYCSDFSGGLTIDQFNQRSDASTISEDGRPLNSYKLTWDSINKKGNEWIASVFFTPPEISDEQLSIFDPISSAKLITSTNKNGGQTASLNGVSGMQFNSSGNTIDSLQDVFQLVKNKQACISDNAQKAEFSWSEKAILDAGLKTEIAKISPTAAEPYACIGS
ncbi:MAG: carboxypeptidase-like regulatory domain-containing protein [archaeon]|nr:carboxypeptidase-like regulatory domain-containing protein [archaeon]